VIDEINLKTFQQQWMEYLVDLKLILNSTHKEGAYVLKRKAPWILFLTNFGQFFWEKPLEGTLVYTHTFAHKIKGLARVNGRAAYFHGYIAYGFLRAYVISPTTI
jgi:hypothetical protein